MNNKRMLAATAGVILMGLSSLAAASDGTITFKGRVESATCVVTGGGAAVGGGSATGANDLTVQLPDVGPDRLTKVNEVAGDTDFTLELSGPSCTDGKIAKTMFVLARSPNINGASGNLNNTAPAAEAAKNVQIRLLNDKKAAIDLRNSTASTTATIAANKASLVHTAQYIAIGGPVEPGQVQTSVVYSIDYN